MVWGKEYQYAQMGLPRKQVTTLTSSSLAAPAMAIMRSVAHARMPAGSPLTLRGHEAVQPRIPPVAYALAGQVAALSAPMRRLYLASIARYSSR